MTNINKSITATIKSISEKKNLIFSFNNKITKIEGNKVFLPDSNLLKKKIDVKNYRGVADFLALNLKYHNDTIYKKFKPKNKLGSKGLLIWENDCVKANKVITDEVPIQALHDFKEYIAQMNYQKNYVSFDFNIGTYRLITRSPYICRLQLIEINSKEMKEKENERKMKEKENERKMKEKENFIIKNITQKFYKDSVIIESSIFVNKYCNNNKFAWHIYKIFVNKCINEQLIVLKRYLNDDVISIIKICLLQ